ncbi:hypothetical protein B0H16DRAFT_1692574 [Mycena metata]|uniref:Uncharacterized protein n=1 Tax=Mycena metata TaxID=1033252 RepID=A0AAD7IN92_9AGAR|nr:hypothetical protein B0H16DRAFT_1692574 [Mycena metata]
MAGVLLSLLSIASTLPDPRPRALQDPCDLNVRRSTDPAVIAWLRLDKTHRLYDRRTLGGKNVNLVYLSQTHSFNFVVVPGSGLATHRASLSWIPGLRSSRGDTKRTNWLRYPKANLTGTAYVLTAWRAE